MSQMIRKQLYLPSELNRQLQLLAKRQQKPEAQVIREALTVGLKQQAPLHAGEALLGLAELGKKLGMTGPSDLSENHDEYLYGDKR